MRAAFRRLIILAATASDGASMIWSSGSNHTPGPFGCRPMTKWRKAKRRALNSKATQPRSNERFAMNRQSPLQRRIIAHQPSALKTKPMTRFLQKKYHEKRGYHCGYRAPQCDCFSSNFNFIARYFDDPRGHHPSPGSPSSTCISSFGVSPGFHNFATCAMR